MKCPRCAQENLPEARFCMACGAGLRPRAKSGKTGARDKVPVNRRKAPKNDSSQVHHHLEKRLAEALDQQTATSDILRVISRSPSDAQPVFDAIIRSAVRLCEAARGTVYRFDGEMVHVVAHAGYSEEHAAAFATWFPRPPGLETPPTRAILERANPLPLLLV